MKITADVISLGSAVLKDKELKKYLYGKKPQGKTQKEWDNEYAAELVNSMYSRHLDETAKVLAEIDGKSEEEYLSGISQEKPLEDLNTVMSDRTFKDLFLACSPGRGNSSSGSATESTEDQSE